MNAQTEGCDHRRIDDFLNSDHVGLEDEELLAHLDSCDACREYLETQAADPDGWSNAARLLKPGEFDQASSVEYSVATIGRHQIDRPIAIQSVLDSLSPSEDPRWLGRLGIYEVSGVVGAGGMGVVLKAIDPSLDRVVAIKVLAPHLANNATARKRFSREAKAAAAVLHPNVIPIHSVSSGGAIPYLVMAYIRGGSLQRRLEREGPLPTVEILRIGSQIAAGLAAAHKQGLVHRDIKPENILLEEGVERVALTDFGLARAVDDASVTREGTIAGTPKYMSPEQARGESVDQKSDLFSLGSVLYALCTGRPPFRAESSYGVMRRISDETPTPIRVLNPEIPKWLSDVIGKLMSKQTADRFESAGEVHDLLEKCLSHAQQPTATRLPEIPQIPQEKSKLPIPKLLVGVLTMATSVTVLLLALGVFSSPQQEQGTDQEQHTVNAAQDDAATQRKTRAFLVEAVKRDDLEAVSAALEAGIDPNGPANRLTALHWAAAQRISDGETIEPSAEIAKLLIAAGADVNAKDYLDQTPLEWAAKYESPDIVEMLIKAGANVKAESRYGTVLQATKSVEIAKLLIEAGADVNAGTTMTPLAKAAQFNNLEMVRLLIEKGAKVNDPKNPPLQLAGKPDVAKALLDAGADVNLRNAKGETVLHLPNMYFPPDPETVKLLIDAGADVKAKNATGATPLHAAIQQGKPEIAKLLIAAGADVDARDKQGNTPLAVAHANVSWARRNPSADNEPYEAAVQLLVDAGAKDDGRTELQQAVAAGDLEQVKKLIAAKADVNETGPQRITAAHLASEQGHAEILAALIEAGAKVDAVDAQRMQPLHLAANAETARLLIANGAIVNTGTPSPLYMATMNGKADVASELLNSDANVKDSDCATMLNWATFAGQLEVVKVLFELRDTKALLAVKSTYSPLHVAASGSFGDMGSSASAQQRLDIAKLLVANGADVNARWGENVNPLSGAAHMIGTTPLMFASQRGEAEMVKFLLDQQADPKATNASGQTALHFAAKYGHGDVVELLLKAKAGVNALTREAKTPLDLTQDATVKVLLIQKGGKTAGEVLKDAQGKAHEPGNDRGEANAEPLTCRSLLGEDVSEEFLKGFPTEPLSLIDGLNKSRGHWAFAGKLQHEGEEDSEFEADLQVQGGFKKQLAQGGLPSWQINLQWPRKQPTQAWKLVLIPAVEPHGVEWMLASMCSKHGEAGVPAERQFFEGAWNAETRTLTWTPKLLQLPGSPANAKPLPNQQQIGREFRMIVKENGELQILKFQQNKSIQLSGQAVARVGKPYVEENPNLMTLPNGYKVFFASRFQVALVDSKGGVVAGARLEKIGCKGDVIYGLIGQREGVAEPEDTLGYFWMESTTGKTTKGMELRSWSETLRAKGINDPQLLDPEQVGPKY